jgi:hypothetical protein
LRNGYSEKEIEETRKNLSVPLYKGPNGIERGTKDYYKTASKKELTNYMLGGERRKLKAARAEMKEDRRVRNKYYRHLHNDYLADKGKERYARGERILTRGETFSTIAKGSALAAAVFNLMDKNGDMFEPYVTARNIAIGSATAFALVNAYAELPMGSNNQLRQYYSHQSLPDLEDKTKNG